MKFRFLNGVTLYYYTYYSTTSYRRRSVYGIIAFLGVPDTYAPRTVINYHQPSISISLGRSINHRSQYRTGTRIDRPRRGNPEFQIPGDFSRTFFFFLFIRCIFDFLRPPGPTSRTTLLLQRGPDSKTEHIPSHHPSPPQPRTESRPTFQDEPFELNSV